MSWYFLASLLAVGCAQPAPPAGGDDSGGSRAAEPASSDRLATAMSAAPAAIASDAEIMDFDDSGGLTQLRPGTNGWMCLPDDDPTAPGESPICADRIWQALFDAYMQGTPPPKLDAVGIAYMLQGGVTANNDDPFAQAPPAGQDWLRGGPHLMIWVPDPAELAGYPTEPTPGRPYVMWGGTPFAHLMVPAGGG